MADLPGEQRQSALPPAGCSSSGSSGSASGSACPKRCSAWQQRLAAGVVIGSKVFNLAALLGLGALVAGRIGLHRRVIALGGTVAVIVAVSCLAAVTGTLAPTASLVLAVAALSAYGPVLSGRSAIRKLRLPARCVA